MCKISTKYILVMIAWAILGVFEIAFLLDRFAYLNPHPTFTAILFGINLAVWPINIMFYRKQKRLESEIAEREYHKYLVSIRETSNT